MQPFQAGSLKMTDVSEKHNHDLHVRPARSADAESNVHDHTDPERRDFSAHGGQFPREKVTYSVSTRRRSYASALEDHAPLEDPAAPAPSSMFLGGATGNTMSDPEHSEKPCKSLNRLEALLAWRLEITALMVSVASFVAILAILRAYHEKPQPEFAYHISINTIVAILSTVLRSMLVFVVSEVIGQSKWSWMETPRPLRDMERFNKAGKGAWGSSKILFFKFKSFLTTIGAFIVITSYAIGPFSQQAAATYSCEEYASGPAKIFIVTNVTETRRGTSTDPDMNALAINGLVYGSTDSSLATSSLFECATGNCTFDSFAGITHTSAGVCSSCTDLSADVSHDAETGFFWTETPSLNVTWPLPKSGSPNGFHMTTTSENVYQQDPLTGYYWGGLTTTSVLSLTVAKYDKDSSVNSSGGKAGGHKDENVSREAPAPPSRDLGILAANCSLYPCVRNYNAKVSNGIFRENLVSHDPMTLAVEGLALESRGTLYGYHIKLIEPCTIKGNSYDVSNISNAPRDGEWRTWRMWKGEDTKTTLELPSKCVSVMGPTMVSAIQSFLSPAINGSCGFASWQYDMLLFRNVSWAPDRWLVEMGCGEKWWNDSLFRKGNLTFQTISDAFDGMATALTNYMRNTGSVLDWNETEKSFVAGSARQTTICIRADWPWLIYPGALLVLTMTSLAVIYIQTYQKSNRIPVWKSAILPLLFYDIKTGRDRPESQDNDRQAVPLLKLSELERLADKTVARFDSNREAPGFVVEKDRI